MRSLADYTRLDISFAVSRLASAMRAPTQRHWTLVKNPLRYLKGTIHFGIVYPGTQKQTSQTLSKEAKYAPLKSYPDSDFASDASAQLCFSKIYKRSSAHCLQLSYIMELSQAVFTIPFNLRSRVHICDYGCTTNATVATHAAISRFA